jgi:hypothetical protein
MMGEYAEMMLEGLIDCQTGEYIDGNAPGYPRSKHWWRKKPRAGVGEERCRLCGKRFKTQQGVEDHVAEIHGGRPALKRQLLTEASKQKPKDKP